MRFIFFLPIIFFSYSAYSQNTFKAFALDGETQESIPGANATVEGTTNGAISDSSGLVIISNIPNGRHKIVFSFIGYASHKETFVFPLTSTDPVTVELAHEEEELEEVVINATRSSRTILDIPTRIEAISGEELDEKATMKPGDIRMQLMESTGIQVQQTSATSANANFRIQGLDGRYTQLLQDGLPLYSGFSSGLSIMQIPPLNLSQIEIIKGSASTLYGGGAIAGLINLVTKKPKDERELSFMGNITSAKGLDLSGFYGQKFKKIGLTIFAASNSQQPYDPNKDGFSDIPQIQRFTFNPKIFFYLNDGTSLSIGINSATENRLGGSLERIKNDDSNEYFEENNSDRVSSELEFKHQIDEHKSFSIKNSIGYFSREISIPDYNFSGNQWSSYTEASYSTQKENTEWIAGINLWTEKFEETLLTNTLARNYGYNTIGAFIQNTLSITEKFALESGLRTDYIEEFGFFVLPRISGLYKVNSDITMRLGGGLGYKTPTIFLQESEEVAFRNVLPINSKTANAEKSIGANYDINYRTTLFDAVSFSINQLFYFTRLNNPLVLDEDSLAKGVYYFENTDRHIDTKGFETNIKFGYQDFKLFFGYTFNENKRHYNNLNSRIPLTPKHKIGTVLMYEVEEKFRIGLEAYYTGSQILSNGFKTQDYWITGLMIEKKWEKLSLYINFENFLDTRQSKFGPLYTGTKENPIFNEIYAPVDGFVSNAGIKVRL